jgi:outer membrane protein TolC
MKRNRSFALCTLFFSLVAGAAGAQEPAATQEPAASQEPQSPTETGEVELTLQQAIEMEIENNLNVVVSRLDTQVQAEGVASAKGVYKPFVSASLNNLDSRSPAQNQLIGANVLASTRPTTASPEPAARDGRQLQLLLAEPAPDHEQRVLRLQPTTPL